MTTTESHPAFSAFEKQLKTLCLNEFPCGTGSWRRSEKSKLKSHKKTLPQTRSTINNAHGTIDTKGDSQFTITLRDYGAHHEKVETLQEYVGSKFSPWHLDYSWSNEAKELRDLSVKSPWIIDNKFVLNYFKTLRIVDKEVTEVDEDILNFKNLEELTLSANRIETINAKNLPESLRVLELCANEVSDISSLCKNPPQLHHLGLGFNKISYVGDYITGNYWPSLLSLDMSHNNLSDLLDVIRKLSTLPKLRNLILQGNPLALIPGYRGYTIDSLRRLNILDDVRISADEKHHFKGLARRREYILDEAKLTLEVSQITGIPMPEEMKNPEEQPEFPIIERRYYVRFMFLDEVGSKAEVLVMGDTEETASILNSARQDMVPRPGMHSEVGGGSQDARSQVSQQEKNVYFNAHPDLQTVQEVAAIPDSLREDGSVTGAAPDSDTPCEEPVSRQLKLSPLLTDRLPWAEELELNWSNSVVRDDLQNLRDFFKTGMEFSIIEEMVLCYPLEEEDGDRASVAGSVSTKKTKEDKNAKADKKGKPEPKKDEKKKKKKEPEQELRRSTPQVTTLATFHVALEEFLEGEFEIDERFTQGGVEVASTVRTESPEPGKKDGKKDKDKRGKSPSATKKDKKEDKGKDKGGKAKEGDKKDAKKGGKGAAPATEEEGEDIPPPPLEVHVTVKLHHWATAMDSLIEEEEKNKSLKEQTA